MRHSTATGTVAALLTTLLLAAPASAATPHAVNAVWVSRSVNFTYSGFTSRYSCRGLKTAITHLLDRLGARDLKVEECPVPERLIRFPSVHVTMQVLVPASGGKLRSVVAAHWHGVRLFPSTELSADCDLMTEFRHRFLPLFAPRTVKMNATCVPHQHIVGNALSAEVLAPNATAGGRH